MKKDNAAQSPPMLLVHWPSPQRDGRPRGDYKRPDQIGASERCVVWAAALLTVCVLLAWLSG